MGYYYYIVDYFQMGLLSGALIAAFFLLLNGIKVCILKETVYILPQCAGNKGGSKQSTRDWKMKLLQNSRK